MSCTQPLSRSCDEYCSLKWMRSTVSKIGQRLFLRSLVVQDSSSPCRTEAPSAAPATQNERATQNEAAPKVINRRRTSADLYEGAPSAAPAMQSEPEVLQVLHLPRKTSWRCSECCACHGKRSGARSNQLSPDIRRPLWRCSKCCTCHAKRAWSAPSAAPATQNELEVLRVLHLPRKTKRRPK